MPKPIKVIRETSVLWLKSRWQRNPLRRELQLSHAFALENAAHRLFDTGEPLVPRRTRSDHYTPRGIVGKVATKTFIQTIKVLDPCPAKVVQRSDLLATQWSLNEHAPARSEDQSNKVKDGIARGKNEAIPPRIHSRRCGRIGAPCRFERSRLGRPPWPPHAAKPFLS